MDVLATHLWISHELQHGQPDFLVLGPSLHYGSVVLRTRRWQKAEQQWFSSVAKFASDIEHTHSDFGLLYFRSVAPTQQNTIIEDELTTQ